MIRFDRRILAVGVFTALALFGCAQPNTDSPSASNSSASDSTTTSTSTSNTTTTSAQSETQGFEGLTSVVAQTKTDVTAGDYATAKTNFDRFEEYWSQVEDGVKAKDSNTYDSIEENADKVTDELKKSQPNKDQVLSTLNMLEQEVSTAAKQ